MRRMAIVAIALSLGAVCRAQSTAICTQGSNALFDSVGAAIKSKSIGDGLPPPLDPVKLPSSPAQAAQDLKDLQERSFKYLYAIGSGASSLASQAAGFSGVYLYVPNPAGVGLTARAGWVGVSPYPEPRAVLQYLRASYNCHRAAVVFTRKSNQEMASSFEAAANEEKMTLKLVGLKGPEELGMALEPVLKDVDVVLLLIDPIAASQDQVRYIVTACMKQKKLVVGFMDSIASVGVPLALYPSPDEMAMTAVSAMKALQTKGEDRKVRFSARFVASVNDNAMKNLGVPYDVSKVVKKY